MSQKCKSPKSFTATEALAAFRRVKLTSASGVAVEYADQTDSSGFIGVTNAPALITAQIGIDLKGASETFKVTAADPFAAGATLYAADDGKVSDTANGETIGTALEAATADGDIVEAFLDAGSSSAPGAAAIGVYSATDGGIPFLIKAVCLASGAEDEVVIASMPRKALVIDAWMIARDANAANVTLKNATDAFTVATAKGTGDDVKVPMGSIIAEHDEIAAEAAVVASFSAEGAVDIFLLCLPIV